jgi:hypothetical protein
MHVQQNIEWEIFVKKFNRTEFKATNIIPVPLKKATKKVAML